MSAGPPQITGKVRNKEFAQNIGKGRSKGVPNKVTAEIKEMALGALSKLGGEKYLIEQGRKNPVAFLGLIRQIIPLQLVGDKQNPIVVQIVQYSAAQRVIDADDSDT